MRTVRLRMLVVGVTLMVAVVAAACNKASPVPAYFNEIRPIVDSWVEAGEGWSLRVDEARQAQSRQLTSTEFRRLVTDLQRAATDYQGATTSALDKFRRIVPPKECQSQHLMVSQRLHLYEQAMALMSSAYGAGLTTGQVDSDALDRGNRLMMEGDLLAQTGLFDLETSKCN